MQVCGGSFIVTMQKFVTEEDQSAITHKILVEFFCSKPNFSHEVTELLSKPPANSSRLGLTIASPMSFVPDRYTTLYLSGKLRHQ